MPAFRFRLEKVLSWYREQCQLEENRLAECLAALNVRKTAMAQLQAQRAAIEHEFLACNELPGSDIVAFGLYRLSARKSEMELKLDQARHETAVDNQRGRVLQAQRRVRLLEKLRERRLAEYSFEEERGLQELASDVYLSTWSRSR